MDKSRVIRYCDRAIEISLCAVAFYIPISNALIESFAGLAITCWLIKKIVSGAFPRRLFTRNFLSLPVWLFAAAMLLSTVFSSTPGVSARHFVFKTVEYLLLFFIACEVREFRVLRNVLIAFVFSATLAGVDGVQQYFTGFDFLRHRPQVIAGRVNGPFSTPNDFSSYIVTLLPVAACLCFIKYRQRSIRFFLFLLSLVLFLCLILSATRSAWVGFLFILPISLLFGARRLFIAGVSVVTFVLCFIPLMPSEVRLRLTHFFYMHEAGVNFHRKLLWDMGISMLAQKPVFGQGLGTFMHNFEKFKPAEYPFNWEISYAHNCFLQMAAETGMVGLLSFLAIVTVFFFTCLARLRSMPKDKFFYIACGLSLGIFAYLAASFFDTALYSLSLSVLFWVATGLTVAAINLSQAK